MKREYRYIPGIEFRAEAEGDDQRKISGYAAVYNSSSVDFGSFTEQIAPGAFTRSLKETPDVFALHNHNTDLVLGRTKAKTLSLREDQKGLFAEVALGSASFSLDLFDSVKRGDIDGMSFGFSVKEEKWEKRDGKILRTLLDVDLYEVSFVAFPAYPATSAGLVEARSVDEIFASCKLPPPLSRAARMKRLAWMEKTA